MDLIGNYSAMEASHRAIRSSDYPIALVGPSGIGKFTWVSHALAEYDPVILSDVNIQTFKDFLRDVPLSDERKFLILNDVCNKSDAVYDAMLKVFEEKTHLVKPICIVEDIGSLPSTLVSRFRKIIMWHGLSYDELKTRFSDEIAGMTNNYSDALFINANPRILKFYNSLLIEPFVLAPLHREVLNDKVLVRDRRSMLAGLFQKASRCSMKNRDAYLRMADISTRHASVNMYHLFVQLVLQ